MYFIKLYILGDSKESTTPNQSSDTENDGVRWLFLGLAELIAEEIECEKGKGEDKCRK